MGPEQLEATRRALRGVRVIGMNPDDLNEGETTDTLAISIDGSVTEALGKLAAAKIIPWPNDPTPQTPLVVESSVIFMGNDRANR